MDEEDFDALARALNQANRVQIHTLAMIAKLQAQSLVQQDLLRTLIEERAGNPVELQEQVAKLYERYETVMLGDVKEWLAKHEMIQLPPNDDWWDKPPSA
jgi:hypothetical protein